jgi:hypothetical protein
VGKRASVLIYLHSTEVADRVLRRLERGDACVMLEKAYRDHWGKSCVGVDWTTWTLDDMKVRANNTKCIIRMIIITRTKSKQ